MWQPPRPCSKRSGVTAVVSNAAVTGRSTQEAMRAMAARGEVPRSLHNNCSGKHAGFVCLACAEGHDPRGYIRPDHPVQEQVRRALVAMTQTPHESDNRAIDGCSIPTYAVPLAALATAFARFGTGQGMPGRFRRCRAGDSPPQSLRRRTWSPERVGSIPG